jgi:serine/threonine protein kinase
LLRAESVRGLAEGARFIAPLHGEFDSRALRASTGTPMTHYLSTGYAAGGELFQIVTTAPGGRIDEARARKWFGQLLRAVAWTHARSVAHLDLSLENCCVDAHDNIQLIDWGLAMLHPSAQAAPLGGQGCGGSESEGGVMDPKRLLRLASEPAGPTDSDPHAHRVKFQRWTGLNSTEALCDCAACFSSAKQLATRTQRQVAECEKNHPAIVAEAIEAAPLVLEESAETRESEEVKENSNSSHSADGSMMMDIDSGDHARFVDPTASQVLLPRCRFLLRPVCRSHLMRPGKFGSSAPELLDGLGVGSPWDAYAADVFALGVMLWSCLTGHAPFVHAADDRARLMISGRWMETAVWRGSAGAEGQPSQAHLARSSHYTHLSANAWDMIDRCFKPQHIRPTVDELLQHPWMDEAHPQSKPFQRV